MPVSLKVHPHPIVRLPLEPVRAGAVGWHGVLWTDQHALSRRPARGRRRVDDELARGASHVIQRVRVDERDVRVQLETAESGHGRRRRERGWRVVLPRPEHDQHDGSAGHHPG